jgi:CheY-like chemotaxis protein
LADILIIDDDPQMQRMLGRILTASGHTVRFAGDGEKGLKLFHEAPPGLVVTDIVMPNTEGIETIRLLRGVAPAVPILAISGSGRHGYLRFAQELGATAVLDKPFSSDAFMLVVSSLLAAA